MPTIMFSYFDVDNSQGNMIAIKSIDIVWRLENK